MCNKFIHISLPLIIFSNLLKICSLIALLFILNYTLRKEDMDRLLSISSFHRLNRIS